MWPCFDGHGGTCPAQSRDGSSRSSKRPSRQTATKAYGHIIAQIIGTINATKHSKTVNWQAAKNSLWCSPPLQQRPLWLAGQRTHSSSSIQQGQAGRAGARSYSSQAVENETLGEALGTQLGRKTSANLTCRHAKKWKRLAITRTTSEDNAHEQRVMMMM